MFSLLNYCLKKPLVQEVKVDNDEIEEKIKKIIDHDFLPVIIKVIEDGLKIHDIKLNDIKLNDIKLNEKSDEITTPVEIFEKEN